MTYPLDAKAQLAKNIVAITTYVAISNYEQMREAIRKHWHDFLPYPPPPIEKDESDIEHLERTFLILTNAADRWYLHYRLDVLESMVLQLYGQDET